MASALGLLGGIVYRPFGIAAAIGVVLYFLGAVITHLRAGDVKGVGTPTVIMLVAVAPLVLGFATLRPCSTIAIGPAGRHTAQPLPDTCLQRPYRRQFTPGTAGDGHVRDGPRRPPRTASDLRAATARGPAWPWSRWCPTTTESSPAADRPSGTVTGGEPPPSVIQWRPRCRSCRRKSWPRPAKP
ncbi:DoxX family protein [Streptomyces sviceus]|uniref:DoxX family protein n=1 Tax=Streptomyces sviceus TaxID=285530 RepID=UPI0036BE933A